MTRWNAQKRQYYAGMVLKVRKRKRFSRVALLEGVYQELVKRGLSISNPNKYRENLVAFYVIGRHSLQVEKESMLPTLVQKLVLEMVDAKAAPNKQTSLMSKFAFSLRPEALVPHDAQRDGIKNAIVENCGT